MFKRYLIYIGEDLVADLTKEEIMLDSKDWDGRLELGGIITLGDKKARIEKMKIKYDDSVVQMYVKFL